MPQSQNTGLNEDMTEDRRKEKLNYKDLRLRAESFLDNEKSGSEEAIPGNVRKLVQELRVAQVELEIQNEDLLATQSQLEESRRRWQVFFDQAPVGYLVTDLNGSVLLTNETFCDMVGQSQDKVRRRFLASLISSPERYEQVSSFFAGLSTTQSQNIETKIKHKTSGRLLDVRLEGRLTTVPLPGEVNEVAVLLTVTDISESQSLRAQLYETQKLESVGRLAGGIAHDFNNSLMIIQGTVDVIRAGEELVPDDMESLLEIDQAVQRAAGMVRHLLEFANKGDAAPRVIAPDEVIQANETMLRRMIPENIDLQYEVPSDLYPVLMDPVQVDQILVNLVLNARDAVQDSGRISITCRNVRLTEEECTQNPLARPGQFVEIAVMDNGRGMSPEVRKQVFEPFFTTKTFGQGYGMGLSSVYGIIQQNRGTIRVESQPGQGTVFTLALPRASRAMKAKPMIMPGHGELQGREKVLVVENESSILHLIRQILLRKGYRVEGFSCPKEALAYFENTADAIDLVISDVLMPGMSGPQLLEAMRQLRPDLKSLFITGHMDGVVDRADLEEWGPVISKPFNSVTLLAAIWNALAPEKGDDLH